MPKKLIPNPEVFNDPDMVGQAEYLAIYEILSNTVEQANDDGAPKRETDALLKAILEEFVTIANAFLDDLKKPRVRPTIRETEE